MNVQVDPVSRNDDLPESADVVVIGGGIIGVSAAYNLAKKGYSVALLEKGMIGAEQSGRNWGWCSIQGRSLPEIPLAKFSLEQWDQMSDAIGLDLGFRRCGLVIATKDPTEFSDQKEWSKRARSYQIDSNILLPSDLKKILPNSSENWLGGLYTASDGRAEPTRAAPAIAEAAGREGVTIHQGCAARGVEITAGRVSAVLTEKGRIRTGAVLCAGGAWTSMFCRRHNISLPQAGVLATACQTGAAIEVNSGCVSVGGYSFRRSHDGGYIVAIGGAGRVELTPQNLRYALKFFPLYLKRRKKLKIALGRTFFRGPETFAHWSFDDISPFEKIRVYDPPTNWKLIDRAMSMFRADYPDLGDLQVKRAWGGFIDSTPDARPVISEVDAISGFFLATGFSGRGFGIGPGAGWLAADLVVGDAPIVDPHPFRYSRFTDGSKVRPSIWD